MGSLPSRRKRIPTQPSSQNSSALGLSSRHPGVNSPVVVAVCDFPSGHTEPMVKMGEQLNLLSEDGEWWKVVAVATGRDCYVPSNHVVKISHRWLYEGINREKAEELLLLPFNHEGSFLIRESQMRKDHWEVVCGPLATKMAVMPCCTEAMETVARALQSLSTKALSLGLVPLLVFSELQHTRKPGSSDDIIATFTGCYSLSIRHTNHVSWDCVKHYRINRLENGWLYISPSLTFSSLQDLVDYYSEIGSGLCCCLKEPCFIQGSSSGLHHRLSKPVIVKKPALNWQEINSSDLLSEDVPEDSPISLGLREAISSYLFVTEDLTSEDTLSKKGRRCKDT